MRLNISLSLKIALAAFLCLAPAQAQMTLTGAGGTPKVASSGNSLSLHSSAQGATVSSGTTVSVTLPSASTGDIILVYGLTNASNGTSPTIADTGAQTWTLASSPVQSHSTANGGTVDNNLTRYMAKASGNLTNDVITLTGAGGATFTFAVVTAMSISGANATPYDANASLPATLSGSATDPITFSTSSANDMIVACYRMASTASPTAGNIGGSAATLIVGANFQLCEYRLVTSTQTSQTATIGTGAANSNGGIVDAIVSQ